MHNESAGVIAMANAPRHAAPRAGLPAATSIISQKTFAPPRLAAPGAALPARAGRLAAYRIIRTNEVDAKDAPIAKANVLAFGAPAPAGDSFAGTSRKAAKLSIADAPVEAFADLRDLIAGLPAKKAMTGHKPKITTDAKSDRVAPEKRNVRVRAFLYAASREDDRDYHLIIGRARNKTQRMYMTVEVSGLPPKTSAAFARLNAARSAYKAFFGGDLPGTSYDFYDPPIPIDIAGSLFFDMSHATGTPPGPKSLRKDMPTIWEIHPVTDIVFEP